MRRNASLIACIVALHTLTVSADERPVDDWARMARDPEPVDGDFLEPGLFELGFDFRGLWAEQDRTDVELSTVGAELSIGYFLTEWFEPGVKGNYLYTTIDQEGSDLDGEFVLGGGQLVFNLPTKTRVVPYLIAAGGFVYAESEDDIGLLLNETGAFWEAGGGFRIFATRWFAVTLEVVFQQLLFEDIGDVKAIVGSAGMSFIF